MKTTYKIAIAALAAGIAVSVRAQSKEVIQIQYTDGITDYIPMEDVQRISFAEGVDTESDLYAQVNAAFDGLKAYMTIAEGHCDFGYPALMLGMDSQTEDLITPYTGYNWFRPWSSYIFRCNSYPAYMMWALMYMRIAEANKIIDTFQATEDADKLLLAQAHALRSWAYWNLVQTYATNYYYGQNDPGVVILTGNQITGEFPLSTVAEVYDLIMNDINLAIGYLEDNAMAPAHIDAAVSKRYVDLAVAYGLRARYNLTMHNYGEAAVDARLAIEKSSARPLQLAPAAYPGFNDAKLGNWMWAITIEPTDRVVTTRIVNFTSHMCSLFDNGYTSVGAVRCCGDSLHRYLERQGADVRLYWFTDENGNNDHLTKAQQKVVRNSYENSGFNYINVKYDNYQCKIINPVPAADVPLMRIEEMYLIRAEGLAMSGDIAGARQILTDLVRTYRNPAYECACFDAQSLQNEIIWQRRAELWGEGLVLFDKLRLRLDLDRYGDRNCNSAEQFRIRGTSKFMHYAYPKMRYVQIQGFDYDSQCTDTPAAGEAWNE